VRDIMVCRQCRGFEEFFDQKWANSELKSYRKRGPCKTTQMLVTQSRPTPCMGNHCWILAEG